MTSNLASQLINNMSNFNTTPSSIGQIMLNGLSEANSGIDIVDPTTPFTYLMSAAATAVSAFASQSEIDNRKTYSKLSKQFSDLFFHMSDKDFIGIYATGASSEINMLVPINLLNTNAIYLNNSTEKKSVVIPRDSIITANGYALGIMYPIQIDVFQNNYYQVTYDTSILNPFKTLTSIVLNNSLISYNNSAYLQITVPVIQYKSTSNIYPISGVAPFEQTIGFSDMFYYARAYLTNNITGVWSEIKTTFNPKVYDINTTTLLLQVDSSSNTILATLPDIYQTLGLAGTTIRIDIYTTQGILNIDLSQLSTSNFSAVWQDFDTLNINPGVAPLSSIKDIIFYSLNTLVGGSNAADFNQVYDKVVNHADSTRTPVLPTDISSSLNAYGYSVMNLIDSTTDRVFIASKPLPERTVNDLTSTPLANNDVINVDPNIGLAGSGYNLSIVNNASQRITLLPTALYKYTGGSLELVSDIAINAINNLTGTALCNALNNDQYMFSPFHYVVDYLSSTYLARPYFLNPFVLSSYLQGSNPNTNYNINTVSSSISLNGFSYILSIVADVPTNSPNITAQLSYYDSINNTTVFLKGVTTITGTTATFVFTIGTTLDIDAFNNIELLNFMTRSAMPAPTFVNINSTFNLFYLVPGNNTGLTTSFDDLYYIDPTMPQNVIGALYENITIEFGSELTRLYCPIRGILSPGGFLKYNSDQPLLWDKTTYKSGPNGYIYNIVNIEGRDIPEFIVDHNLGDQVLHDDGTPVILHHAGDTVVDVNGNSIPDPLNPPKAIYQIGVTLIDAKYKYATATATVSYTNSIASTIQGYLNNDIEAINNILFGRSELFYRPTSEPNQLEINNGDTTTTLVAGILNIQVTYYVTNEGLNSTDIQSSIKTTTKKIISKYLNLTTISMQDFSSELNAVKPSQVLSFSVDSFLPNNLPMVSITDITKGFSIGESLTLLPDGTLDIVDNTVILFKPAP